MEKEDIVELTQNMASDIGQGLVNQLRDIKLLESRTIFLSEPVNANLAKRIVGDLFLLEQQSKDPIRLMINSPGGEVNSGFAIYDAIKFIEAPVFAITAGLCASIATIINIAVKKEHRFGFPNSKYLIHQPLIMGQIYGQASDIEITARDILRTREKINKLLAEECGQKLDKVEEDTSRDYWMDASEAVEYGLIGKTIENVSELPR